MTSRQQWAVIGGVVAALSAVLFVASTQLGSELFPLKIGSKAP